MKKRYTLVCSFIVFVTIFSLQNSFGQCTPTFNDGCSIALHSFGLSFSPTSTMLIEDTETACSGPSSSGVINVTAGYTYNFDLNVFSAAGSDNTSAFFSIFLDKNNDGDFEDAGERLYYNNSTEIFKAGYGPDEFASDVITIPTDAITGVDLKFRVLVVAANDLGAGCNIDPSDACGTYCGGEIHDYTLNIAPVPICPLIFLNGCSISLHSFSLSSVSPATTLINDLETACSSPSSSTAINVKAGDNYNFDLTVNSGGGSDNVSAFFSIWLDKNNDGDFSDTGERLFYNNTTEIYKAGYGPPESASGSITIPHDALTGTDLKFRVLVVAANDLGDGCNTDPDNACGVYCGGEVHDYLLNIETPACNPPNTPTVNNVTACAGTNVTLTATCATGTAYWYESVSATTPLGGGNFVVNNVSSPNKTYSVSCEISETCVSNRAEQSIIVIEIPNPPTVSGQTICNGSTASLTANCTTGTAKWYESNTSTTVLGSGNFTTPILTSSTTYFVACESGGIPNCVSARTTQMVIVNDLPNPPTASGQTICSGTTASLTATCSTGTAKWYESNTSTTVLGSGTYTTPILTSSTTYFIACESGGVPNCVSARTTQMVTVNDLPSPPTASGQTICNGSTASLTANCTTGTAKWYESSTSTTILGSGNFTTPILTSSTTYFIACESEVSPNCVSARTTQMVTVNDLPNLPTASGQTICSGTTASLTATCSTGTAKWYESNTSTTVLGSGTYTTPNLTSSITYFVACESGGSPNCVSARTIQMVTVNDLPNPPTASGQTICSGTTASLTATCSTGTAKWYESSTSTTILGSENFTTPILTSSTAYFVACESGGVPNCVSARTTQMVTVNDLPNPPTATGQTICSGTTASLTANCTTGTAKWYESSTSTTVLGSGNFTTPILTNSTTYFVACESGGMPNCVSARTTQMITVNDLPNLPTASGQTICSGTTASLIANCTTGTAKWYESSTSTTILGSGNFTTPILTSSTTYFIACESGGSPNCVSARTTQMVTVNNLPNLPTASGQTICSGTTASLTATCSTGTAKWYEANTSTTVLGSGTYTTPILTSSTTYFVACESGGIPNCVSTRTNQIINLASYPLPNSASNSPVCAEQNINLVSSGGTSYSWQGPQGFTSTLSNPVIQNAQTPNEGIYKVTITNQYNCSVTSTVSVIVNIKPVAPIGFNKTLCTGDPSSTLTATGFINHTLIWYGNNSTGGISSTIAPIINPTTPTIDIYYVSMRNNFTGCESNRASIIVTVNSKPIPPLTAPLTVCQNSPTQSLTANAQGDIYTLLWYGTNSTGGVGSTIAPIPSTNTVGITNYYVSKIDNVTGCESNRETLIFTINPLPISPVISANKTSLCNSETATLSASGCNGSIRWNTAATGASLIISLAGTYSAFCINSCGTSNASNQIIITKNITPSAPIISSDKTSICDTEIARLTAVGCSGSINWSNGATGSFIQVSSTGTFSATCSNSCGTSLGSNIVTITQGFSPSAPVISSNKTIMCDGERATLTASGCSGQIRWSTGATTPSVELSVSGTFGATCVNFCGESRISNLVTLRAGVSPTTPTIALTSPILCNETSKILTATGCNGEISWNNNSRGTTLTVTTAGTYTAVCETICGVSPRANILNVQFLPNPIPTATNTGPYEIGQKIQLSATGGNTYLWRGANDFLSTNANVSILNAGLDDRGVYTVTVTNTVGCTATATSNVVVNPCSQMFKYDYVKAGTNFEYFFPITDGMTINAMSINTGIIATPICQLDTVNTPSVRIQMTGPEPLYNRDIIENIYPYSPFENRWFQIFGPIFPVGEYTLTVTGYSQEYAQGNVMFGPQTIHFTIVGNSTSITMAQNNISEICAGSSFDVSFETTGDFLNGNVFEVQLSNANGSFEVPIKIGESNNAGIVNCQIPANIQAGSAYKTRVFATKPAQMSNSSSLNLKINPRNISLQSPTDDISALVNKKAGEKITAANKVQTGGNATFQAGRSINLEAGFSVNAGAIFKAEIGACN